MCDGMAADAEREFAVYEQELGRFRGREILAESVIAALRADLARALPVVEAAGRVVAQWSRYAAWAEDQRRLLPSMAESLDALRREVER
jgi:hypothetical protein